ncbi:MAG TPA: hypothetical protein VFT95_06990 [Micromonosporaceae bacterium]|nr:hypothetical protein [Micromonosporaceae bacterium]
MAGVVIGEHALIGAGSQVTRDIPAGAVATACPPAPSPRRARPRTSAGPAVSAVLDWLDPPRVGVPDVAEPDWARHGSDHASRPAGQSSRSSASISWR